MISMIRRLRFLSLSVLVLAACSSEDPVDPGGGGGGGGGAVVVNVTCTNTALAGGTPPAMGILGCGRYLDRYTAEVFVRGTTAYTTTWGTRGLNRGNALLIWDVAGAAPVLVDSVIVVSGATTLGDVAVSDDGRLLVVATEPGPLALIVFDLTNPRKPVESGRLTTDGWRGAHTAELATINGRVHAIMAQLPSGSNLARVAIADLGNPAAPAIVHTTTFPGTIIHDTFYRDGYLFLALWNQGLAIWDLGGAGRGGTVRTPVELGRVITRGGAVHNAWWFHDPSAGASGKRYVFVGEEQPTNIGTSAAGDLHVVDITDPANPREVAFYTVAGAGAHNFTMDEARGILYAAFYNGGVRALDVRGDLSACSAAQKDAFGRCDLTSMARELGRGLLEVGAFSGLRSAFIWGVHFTGDAVYASDMNNGLWKLRPVQR